MYYGLCFSGIGETRTQISNCFEVSSFDTINVRFHLSTSANALLTLSAYRIARDPRFERLPCSHKGTYADDCLVQRIMQHKCYIVATCDRDLKRRIRKVPGIPIMYISSRKYVIERLPELGTNTF